MKIETIILPPKPTHITIEDPNGRVIGRDLRTGQLIREGRSVPIGFHEADCGGVFDGVGTVFSDADPGL